MPARCAQRSMLGPEMATAVTRRTNTSSSSIYTVESCWIPQMATARAQLRAAGWPRAAMGGRTGVPGHDGEAPGAADASLERRPQGARRHVAVHPPLDRPRIGHVEEKRHTVERVPQHEHLADGRLPEFDGIPGGASHAGGRGHGPWVARTSTCCQCTHLRPPRGRLSRRGDGPACLVPPSRQGVATRLRAQEPDASRPRAHPHPRPLPGQRPGARSTPVRGPRTPSGPQPASKCAPPSTSRSGRLTSTAARWLRRKASSAVS